MAFQTILSNFALILFILLVVSGIVWFLDVFRFSKERKAKAEVAIAEWEANQKLQGIEPDAKEREKLKEKLLKQPFWIEYSGSFFPIILAVFVLRSFLYEPFKIPSSSMVPTLEIGDLILVNKFTYGIRLPVLNKKIISINDPQRGDMVVFKYPKDTSLDYIKRVVGVSGDKIVYRNKRLVVNGEEATYQPLPDYLDPEHLNYFQQYVEKIGPVEHRILTFEEMPAYVPNPDRFLHHEMCTYFSDGFSCTVPKGYYFMMGDNRDNSLDSRYWGFVPDNYIVGKAFFVWMNLSDMKRVGSVR